MDRRILVASVLALPFASRLSFAQGTGAPGPGSPFDEAHITRTNMVGALLLETSRMALEKSQDKAVRQFATFEVAEQEAMADVLKALADPQATASHSPKRNDVNAAPSLGPQGGVSADKLSALTGAEFDKAYVAAQTQAHQQLLEIQDAVLKAGQAPREQVGIARLAQAQIKEHLVLLGQLPGGRG